ncbi:adenylate/guanylate cyclase domain-containing protein [Ktedonobacter racemifer]|nr:adenylate/guanylate cyclase domain-containing protein [Ktedonobacter racemifer]
MSNIHEISESLMRISRLLHEHTHKLEVAVEGTYAGQTGDPRVSLLMDALLVARKADLELGRNSQALKRLTTQQLSTSSGKGNTAATRAVFERERAELQSNITFLKKQRDEQGILADIARTLNSTLEFDEVLRLVMDRVIEFVSAERGFLMLVDQQTQDLEFKIARDKQARTIPESEFMTAGISRGVVKRTITTLEPLVSDDAKLDASLNGHESIMTFGIRSMMCAPLVVRDHCIGAVYVDSRINANLFSQQHLDLLVAFCNQAAIAIDNARLFADLNRAIQQVQDDKQYMDNIFASIANGVVTIDSRGYVTTFNASAGLILQINNSQAIGRHYTEAFASHAHIGVVDLLRNALEHAELHAHGTFVPSSVDNCIIPNRLNGPFSLNLYVSSLRDTQGAHIGAALVIDDRTEIKRSEAETKKIRGIFERYVHPNVVKQLIRDKNALNLGGETKEISVLFADIRGFTRLSESMPPEAVMDMINRYMRIMCEAIWEEEGTITAFLGDAVMAIFNAPLPQEQHALRAVRAAWKMRMAVQGYQQTHPQERFISFGIGVNTGLATVGNIGSQERMQNYTAIGDVVNVASRLQNNVSDNDILLNDTTYQQVYPYVRTGQPFQLSVKNKATPLTVRYLLGPL